MSETGVGATTIVAVPLLLAELLSLVAPVPTFTVDDPTVVGVPDTGQEIEAPAANSGRWDGGACARTVSPQANR